jgi:hypothetical protein
MEKRARIPGTGYAGRISIRAHCAGCGDVRFPAAAITVHADTSRGTSHVSYACPRCGVRSAVQVPTAMADMLRQQGSSVWILTRPAEADEVHDGPPFTEAEVTAFAAALQHPGWEAELS